MTMMHQGIMLLEHAFGTLFCSPLHPGGHIKKKTTSCTLVNKSHCRRNITDFHSKVTQRYDTTIFATNSLIEL